MARRRRERHRTGHKNVYLLFCLVGTRGITSPGFCAPHAFAASRDRAPYWSARLHGGRVLAASLAIWCAPLGAVVTFCCAGCMAASLATPAACVLFLCAVATSLGSRPLPARCHRAYSPPSDSAACSGLASRHLQVTGCTLLVRLAVMAASFWCRAPLCWCALPAAAFPSPVCTAPPDLASALASVAPAASPPAARRRPCTCCAAAGRLPAPVAVSSFQGRHEGGCRCGRRVTARRGGEPRPARRSARLACRNQANQTRKQLYLLAKPRSRPCFLRKRAET